MIHRRSRVSIIRPVQDEDITDGSRDIITNYSNTTTDVNEGITTTTTTSSNQNNISTESSSQYTKDIILIWLELNPDNSDENINESINKLQKIINSIQIFRDPDECFNFVTEDNNAQIFMITSDVQREPFVCSIEHISKVHSIYIIENSSADDEQQWILKHKKVKGIFSQVDDIYNILKRDINALTVNLEPFSIIPRTSTNSNELDQSFMYTQLLKEIILKINHDDKARKEFIEFCRIKHQGDNIIADKLEKFDRTYKDHSPVWWYTSVDPFIYTTVNKALRTQDIETMIKMGFYLRDLHEDIERKYLEAHPSDQVTVYRGQGMSSVDFEKLRNNEGGLLSFNNYLSTTRDRDVSLAFAESNRASLNMIEILFQMEILPSVSVTPYISVADESIYGDEEEILFSMHTVFRINKIEKLDDKLWQVMLTLTDDNDPQLKQITECIRNEIGGANGWLSIATLLHKMGKFDKALEVYTTVVETTFNDSSDEQKVKI